MWLMLHITHEVLLFWADANSAPWYNKPGLEAWKFFNLILFVSVLALILRRPLAASLRARREGIRHELTRARQERDKALAKLEEVNARLANLTDEVKVIQDQAQQEAVNERARLNRMTDEEMRRLREQAQREIENAAKLARQELQREAAEQSIRLAEETIRRELRPEDESRLLQEYAHKLQGVNH